MTQPEFIPFHVGLLADGIRRWSKAHNVTLTDAYDETVGLVATIISFLFDQGVTVISAYLLSKDNLQRRSTELDAVYSVAPRFFDELMLDVATRYAAKVLHIGDPALIPAHVRDPLQQLCHLTATNTRRKIYLLVAYHPIDELMDAISKSAEGFQNHLWVTEPVDLIIRTGDVYRLSNFLPLQSAYAELCFLSKMWNDVTEVDIASALFVYRARERRFGR